VSVAVHVVIVSYRSADTLRRCVEPLAAMPDVHVTVVDNASPDDAVTSIADLDIEVIRSPRNGGFSYGCNLGSSGSTAPFLLFLNPDARMDPPALGALCSTLRTDHSIALVAPRILEESGTLAWSQRRFPRQRSTFAQALFLHRVWPRAAWTDELIRDPEAYERPTTPDWVSGACMLVRREAFEAVGGFDEGFFLYCEDADLCRRLWDAGRTVRFEPGAQVRHIGGGSSATGETQAIAASSRVRYAHKHFGPAGGRVQALGVALGEITHAGAALLRPASRRGHLAAVRAILAPPAGAGRHG
jgi:GT2 family glycosyltransferase